MKAKSREITLFKYQILGNSYLVWPVSSVLPQSDLLEAPSPRSEAFRLRPEIVRRLCSVDYGVGSSGLVLGPFPTQGADASLRIYNEDGTTCLFSGNATRILARYMKDIGAWQAAPDTPLRLKVLDDTPSSISQSGEHTVIRFDEAAAGDMAIELGAPRMGPQAITIGPNSAVPVQQLANDGRYHVPALAAIGARATLARDWSDVHFVNVGNPHCVVFVPSAQDLPASDFNDVDRSAFIALSYSGTTANELSHVFPAGCNLQFVHVHADRKALTLRTFERGGGPTKSSGSSSSAAAAAAYARGLVDETVVVHMPGGAITIRLSGSPQAVGPISLQSRVDRIGSMSVAVADLLDSAAAPKTSTWTAAA